MPRKSAVYYICRACGATFSKWSGYCNQCSEWNSLEEERDSPSPISFDKGHPIEFVNLSSSAEKPRRLICDLEEFDRVTGGGIVAGSALLIGGDPGIGKSTLLMQVCAKLSLNTPCIYISGEESAEQLQLRAARLGFNEATVSLAIETSVRNILATLETIPVPSLVVIDSIQTMYFDQISSTPGSINQVRSSAHELVSLAKKRGFSLVLIGHVTREGQIAGPRVLEHMVDAVLYFEGDRHHQFRLLRAIKNRYGPTNEIGIFEMTGKGLNPIDNPSALFLEDHKDNISGNCVFAAMEGQRPVLVEFQTLLTPSNPGQARRSVVGADSNRLSMITAVLEARCNVSIGGRDIYLNIAGGLKIVEPAADLAIAASLLSSFFEKAFLPETVVLGEVNLSGTVRSVPYLEQRLSEAKRLGFRQAVIPALDKLYTDGRNNRAGIKLLTVKSLLELSDLIERKE